jgi:hypothetical protein
VSSRPANGSGLDDAWNAQDVEVFRARHKPDVMVGWPGQREPTRAIEDHLVGVASAAPKLTFQKSFPDRISSDTHVALEPALYPRHRPAVASSVVAGAGPECGPPEPRARGRPPVESDLAKMLFD